MAATTRRWFALAGLVLLPALASAQQTATITGRATGDAGAPLAAVTITIPELGVGTLTRDDGRYAITVPGARVAGQTVTLSARRVGFKPKLARVLIAPGTITQDFLLEANPLQLGEVVVTGAGTSAEAQKLGNVRNSVSAELIVKSNEPNLVQALAGKAPNVQVAQSSGDPGAASHIQIRGLRTLNGNTEPLFVVDGVPVNNSTFSTTNLNPVDAGGVNLAGQENGGELEGTSAPNRLMDINPNDIENVEILKGAAAAAIYGARAGDVALSYGATGGIYLGGGIAPKLLPHLLEGGFMRALRWSTLSVYHATSSRSQPRSFMRALRWSTLPIPAGCIPLTPLRG